MWVAERDAELGINIEDDTVKALDQQLRGGLPHFTGLKADVPGSSCTLIFEFPDLDSVDDAEIGYAVTMAESFEG
mgnify:CR=1 FL=1